MKNSKLPLLINGEQASYFFDTGANLSTISESDSLRFAMEIQEAKGGVTGDVHGNTVSYRIATA
jgi:predicted aspartyl protease